MKMSIRGLARNIARRLLKEPFARTSYSQEGEDMILRRLFENQPQGFYVDVGAHHPVKYSNTFYFYKQGWRGINIDAMPGSMDLFKVTRSLDINIESAIGKRSKRATYFQFNDPALNTFDRDLAQQRNCSVYYVVKEVHLEKRPLSEILAEYLKSPRIDFLNVDVEGLDLEVLRSNDWKRFRPFCVLVERTPENRVSDFTRDRLFKFMTALHYEFCAKTVNTLIFTDTRNASKKGKYGK